MFTFFVFFILFIKLKVYSYVSMTIYIILGLFIFIVASNKFTQSSELVIRAQSTLTRVCLIIFFVSFSLSVVYSILFESFYSTSLWYYILIGICTSALFIMSIFIEDNLTKRLLPYLTLLLGLNIFLSNFIIFPNGVYTSGDTHYQIYNILLPIVENGYIPSGFTYSFFPTHHILVASLAEITGIKPVFLYMSMVRLLYVVSVLFVYSLINRAGATRFGITAMLLFITAPSIFYHGTHPYQFSYALPLGILLMYVTVVLTIPSNYKAKQNLTQNRASWTLIHILAIGVLIFTHQFTSTIIFVLIVILQLIYYIVSKNNINKVSFHYSVLFLYIVMLFFHWIYISSVFPSLKIVFDVYSSSLFNPENYHAASSSLNSNTSFFRQPWLIFLDTSGIGIMMMLGSMGSLYGVWKKNKYIFVWVAIGVIIWTLISIGELIKMPLLLGNRLFAFSDTMSFVYLSTFGVILLIERFGIKGFIFCSVLFLLMPIFSLGSTLSGSETSLFVGDQPYIKFYDTNSDLQYRTWLKNTVPENSNIWVSESWVLQFLDNKRVYNSLPVDDQDHLADNIFKLEDYVILSKHDSVGLRVRGISEWEQINSIKNKSLSTVEAKSLHERVTKLNMSEIKRVTSQLKCIYSNGETNICLK